MQYKHAYIIINCVPKLPCSLCVFIVNCIGGKKMTDYTIRDCDTGAVVCTGYAANSEEEAEELFMADHPDYDGDVYAAVGQWND